MWYFEAGEVCRHTDTRPPPPSLPLPSAVIQHFSNIFSDENVEKVVLKF